jgi:putative nucleotidyltransferase with HDIG domain
MSKLHRVIVEAIEKLAQAVGLRDAYTGEHSRRVSHFAILLGRRLDLSAEDLEWIRIGTPLHDIGKIGIEDATLRKPGMLTSAEFEVMKTHTTKGADIVAKIPDLDAVVAIVRSHHERWDGGGYPDGFGGEEIPRLARIVTVANAFDAMAFETPYRRALYADIAFAEIERQRGRQFDPEIVTAFLQIRDQLAEDVRRFGKERDYLPKVHP